MASTRLQDLIDPEVLGGIISAKIPARLVVAPFANIDTTLQGQPGSTITIPRYNYIGDAVVVPEEGEIPEARLTAVSVAYSIQKAAQGALISDEALLSAYGNPMNELGNQLAKSVAGRVDTDALDALLQASRTVEGGGALGYGSLVTAIDDFEEEFNSDKVLFVNPRQVTQLRLDPDFLSADKYQAGVAISGEIGRIANTRIVISKKIVADETTGDFLNPLVKLNSDAETEDDMAALTMFLKRTANVETDREVKRRRTHVSIDQHYVAALTDDAKVRLVAFDGVTGTP